MQLCIVRLVRAALRCVNTEDRKSVARHLKMINPFAMIYLGFNPSMCPTFASNLSVFWVGSRHDVPSAISGLADLFVTR
jgi:hypothetical protein